MKVSDFAIAQYELKELCAANNVLFADVVITFEEGGEGLYICDSTHVCQTIYKIIESYIKNSERIVGKKLSTQPLSEDDYLLGLTTSLRSVAYTENRYSPDTKSLFLQGLYQKPLVWLLMKDIICPLYDIPLKNIKIVTGLNPQVDIAQYYEQGEIETGELENYPFVFINEIDSQPVLNAFLFIETLKAYELNASEVLLDIFESEIYEKFQGLLELALSDISPEAKDVFTYILANTLRIPGLMRGVQLKKIAQNRFPEQQSQFWFMGLTEGMLDRVRGADWSTTKALQPFVEEFWNKVEDIKKQRNGHGVPFNELLAIRREGSPGENTDATQTLQSLLSSSRVW